MQIVLLGAGNVATHLGMALYKAGHTIVQVYSRTEISAETLASCIGAEAIVSLGQVCTDADLYLIAMKDDILSNITTSLPPVKGIVAHTAGSVPLSILSSVASGRYGVFYPLQTFSKKKPLEFSKIPLFVEGSTLDVATDLHSLAKTVGCSSYNMDSDGRKQMHLAAVFACNFTNHLFTLSEELLEQQGLPFSILLPLIEESVHKILEISPSQAQTGPAIRGDQAIINAHLSMLSDPMKKEIYRLLSESIMNRE